MRTWHDTESCGAAERHAKAAAAPPIIGIYTRQEEGARRAEKRAGGKEGGGGEGRGREGGGKGGGREGGGRGGVLPKRLRSGSGHHRPDVCALTWVWP